MRHVLHLQQLLVLVQTVKMRTGKLSTLLSAVLLELPSSCRNDYGKLAMTVNEMAGFYPSKWMKWGIYLSMITAGILYSEKIQLLLTGVEPLTFGLLVWMQCTEGLSHKKIVWWLVSHKSPVAHLWWPFNQSSCIKL